MKRYYYSFSEYLKRRFDTQVRRVSLNAGFGCPNRDGTLGSDGCAFCNEKGFASFPEKSLGLEDQIKSSTEFFRARFKAKKFIAYFQNACNTYACVEDLKEAYDVIKHFPDIVGLFISTRPDCIDEEKLGLIESYADNYDTWIEYGLQSIHDKTLERLNRLHTFSQFLEAVNATAKKKIKMSAHVILGLPGESKEDMMKTAIALSDLPLSGVKIHVFHVMRDTKLEKLYRSGKIELVNPEEYAGLACDFLERLNPDIVIMRLVSNARDEVLLAPKWINDKQKLLSMISAEFKKRGTYQGIKYEPKKDEKAGVA